MECVTSSRRRAIKTANESEFRRQGINGINDRTELRIAQIHTKLGALLVSTQERRVRYDPSAW